MYIGQALIVIGLGFSGSLSVGSALYAMAVSAGLSAIVHSWQLELALPTRSSFRAVLADFWSIGGTASLGNGYLALGRIMVVPWALAAISGPAAAAGYQAAANIVNLSNPLVLGLGNIIPQAAASASAGGNAHAWRAVRSYVLIALPPIALYSVVILAVPGESLRIFYGAASDYMHVISAVRLLILVSLAGFAIEAVIAFLHGITSVRQAATINIAGSATSAIIVLPLVSLFGLNGGCITLLLANAVRLVLTHRALARVTAPQLRSSDIAVVHPAALARPVSPH
jgi:O-antigen/teichoic acid export membrane protein